MSDITYCRTNECPLRTFCIRNNTPSPLFSSYFYPKFKEEIEYLNCDIYIGSNEDFQKVKLLVKRKESIKKILKEKPLN